MCRGCRYSGQHHVDLGRKHRPRMAKVCWEVALLELVAMVVMAEGAEEVVAPSKLGPVVEVAAAVVEGGRPK